MPTTVEARKSTNEKLDSIINGKDDEDTVDEYVLEEEQKARIKLRKSYLYGVGARAKVPKVKYSPKYEMSPFRAPEPSVITGNKTEINSAVPPGAHQDLYRIVQFPTTKSRNDPDRIFFTTSKFTEGVVAVEQPPWYYGNNNKTKPADDSMVTAAARYGFRGSRSIKQFHVSPVEASTNTRTPYTPKFLDREEIINEWVPPILATTFQTINRIESPKLWPQNTEYVTGYKKKKLPSSSVYKRETTVADKKKFRPQTSQSLTSVLNRSFEEKCSLNDYAKMETCQTWQSLPMLAQSTFENTWSDRVKTAGTNGLHLTMNTTKSSYDPHTLVDPSDEMKYSGSTAFIVHSQTNEELKFRLQMERNNNSIPYELRWRQVEFCYRGMKSKLKKDHTMAWAINELASKLRKEAIHHGSPTSMRRAEFIPLSTKISQLDGFSHKQLSLLYSAFDPRKRNVMRFVEVIASLVVLDDPLAMTLSKITSVWKVYREFGSDVTTFDMALSVLCSCCGSDDDRVSMETLFKDQFRPICYRMSVMERLDRIDQMGAAAADVYMQATQGLHNSSSDITTTSPSKRTKDLSVQPQFNICDNYLDDSSFIRVLEKCPSMIAAFEEQMTMRIIHFYGRDPRLPVEEEPAEGQ